MPLDKKGSYKMRQVSHVTKREHPPMMHEKKRMMMKQAKKMMKQKMTMEY